MLKYETKRTRNQKIKENIFTIAMKLMKKVGYEKLTISDICDAAEISTGMFYRHFESKDELLVHYYTKAQEVFVNEVKANLDDKDMKSLLIKYYRWYAEYTANSGVDFCRNYFTTRNHALNTHEYSNHVLEFSIECLRRAVAEGFKIPKGRTLESLGRDLCVIAKGAIFDWCVHEGEYSLPDYVEDLMGRAIDGVLCCGG